MEYLGAFLIVLAVILLFYGMNKKSSVHEQFTSKSNKEDVKAGASTFYDWSGGMKTCSQKKVKKEEEGEEEPEQCDERPVAEHTKCNCENCDITKMPGIDKYVLKSSVPPCPDMSNYAEKSMIKPDVDLSKYTLKADVKPCAKCPDMSEYVHKSEIPAKVECPKCPTCPVCPICPDVNKSYQKGYNDAMEHIKETQQKTEEEKPKPKPKENTEEQRFRKMIEEQNEKVVKRQQQQLQQQQQQMQNQPQKLTGYNPSLMDFHAQFEQNNTLTNRNTVFGDRDNRVHNGLC